MPSNTNAWQGMPREDIVISEGKQGTKRKEETESTYSPDPPVSKKRRQSGRLQGQTISNPDWEAICFAKLTPVRLGGAGWFRRKEMTEYTLVSSNFSPHRKEKLKTWLNQEKNILPDSIPGTPTHAGEKRPHYYRTPHRTRKMPLQMVVISLANNKEVAIYDVPKKDVQAKQAISEHPLLTLLGSVPGNNEKITELFEKIDQNQVVGTKPDSINREETKQSKKMPELPTDGYKLQMVRLLDPRMKPSKSRSQNAVMGNSASKHAEELGYPNTKDEWLHLIGYAFTAFSCTANDKVTAPFNEEDIKTFMKNALKSTFEQDAKGNHQKFDPQTPNNLVGGGRGCNIRMLLLEMLATFKQKDHEVALCVFATLKKGHKGRDIFYGIQWDKDDAYLFKLDAERCDLPSIEVYNQILQLIVIMQPLISPCVEKQVDSYHNDNNDKLAKKDEKLAIRRCLDFSDSVVATIKVGVQEEKKTTVSLAYSSVFVPATPANVTAQLELTQFSEHSQGELAGERLPGNRLAP